MEEELSERTISIAMATYNGAPFIREQLDSLAAQTHLPMELVVSDDGSTDETLEIIETFAKDAPFEVRILPEHPRLGFSDNFLHAAEQCRGALIAFCDQDDGWLPHKLEAQIARMKADDSLLALHRLIVTDAALTPTGDIWNQDLITEDRVFEPLTLNPYRTGWGNSMLFARTLVHLAPKTSRPRQPEERQLPLSHDTWLYVLAAGLGRVSHMMEPLLLYRQHGTNTYGVSRPSTWVRLYCATTIPESRFRDEALFHAEMAAVFDQIAQGPGPFKCQAGMAAKTSRERSMLCDARLQTYNGERFWERLAAFRRTRRVASYQPWIGSTLKDIVLGVAGMSKPATRYVRRKTAL